MDVDEFKAVLDVLRDHGCLSKLLDYDDFFTLLDKINEVLFELKRSKEASED